MEFVSRTIHPFGTFDLAAIGSVLIVVMLILGVRRLMRRPAGPPPPQSYVPSEASNRSNADDSG
ncbi:hypothetical protein [uncultured Hoeflea sp.]|uniref:hypothetical protein n=1 Tax=uncultured Hoeflea sp. TaxID=538666 RepID=UPI00261ED8A7|nr:hypothetical protein [uncultured Hoeflea sp.]